ncbi:MAG: hypothetical protein NT129_03470 [Candidatus Aenigmarchaeota archaeon]|nr:hypothetical protein [Candidatus Aenigmarchaeota archaeon]
MAIKKQWYEIIAPKMFDEKVVGETVAADPKQLAGRTIEVSLMDIAKDYSKFFVKLKLQVEKVEGSKAYTKFVGHSCMRERVYRMVQRRVRKVECIQTVKTADEKNLTIKTVFVLIRRVNTSTKDDARKKAKELIAEAANKFSLEDLIGMIIKGELQNNIRKTISKIYPVGDIEVRETKIL